MYMYVSPTQKPLLSACTYMYVQYKHLNHNDIFQILAAGVRTFLNTDRELMTIEG